jgi:two-component system, LytTR family, sensor kinase
MPRTLLKEAPFFEDKNRAFWTLQSAGWAGYFVLRSLTGIANGAGWLFVVPTALATATGYSLTLLMSAAYRRLFHMRPIATWGGSMAILIIASMVYSSIETWAHATLYRTGPMPQGIQLLSAILLDFALLAAWSSLYYGINFYILVEEQRDQLLRLESQASSAQLAMLRYQLNPHFLFNTLNSISTLVLLKETERANAMLSRLADFLRFTLIYEPTAHVTVAQEVQTLKLYLEIEKMRFEKRLRPVFEIDPRAERARLPSLLLQPLVENAIKYAVTPSEEGAEIAVSARLVGERVLIAVSDTGPGLIENKLGPSLSTGVGLANIRDRLAQAYGPDHRFDSRSTPGGGFAVEIEIPYQLDDPSREAA